MVADVSIKNGRTNLAAEKMSLRSAGLRQETALVRALFKKISVRFSNSAYPHRAERIDAMISPLESHWSYSSLNGGSVIAALKE